MDIDILRECHHLSQSLSFTETAKHFYITQSALSRHIASLESELGVKLFIRSKNGVHLTKAGRVFVADILKIIADYEQALRNLNTFKQGFNSVIKLGYLFGATSSFLADAIASFSDKYPTVFVSASSLEINEIISALDQNKITIAITSGVWRFPEDRFSERNLYPDGTCLMLPPGHALVKELAGRERVNASELRGRSDLFVPDSSIGNYETAEYSKLLDISDSNTTNSLIDGIGNLLSIEAMMLSSGNGFVSYRHLENVYGGDRFVVIPVDTAIEPFYVRAVWKRSQESEALLAFVEELVKASEGFSIGKDPRLTG